MSKFRILMLTLLVVLVAVPFSALAQDPGTGGPVIEGNFSGSVNIGSFNAIRCGGTDCSRITGLLYPTVIGASGDTQNFGRVGEAGVVGALGTDWTISEDGLVYTVTLRDDAFWSDGEPITAEDVKFSFEAIASGEAEATIYQGSINYVEGANPAGIAEVVIVDDYTVEFHFAELTCVALGKIGYPVIPAHAFGFEGDDFEGFDYSVLVGHEFDTAPSVTYGPFQFGSLTPGESVGLVADTNYGTLPAGFVYRDVPDQTVLFEQFLAGETNFLDNPPVNRREELRNSPDHQVYEYDGNSWDYVGLNLADPTNPQPGLDEDGNPIDQGMHPIFGNSEVGKDVRRALQLGIDVQSMIEGAVFGEGSIMASSQLPGTAYVDESLAPVPYDPALAAELLDGAGWPLEGDVRVCRGCETAEDGTPFEFSLITNAGNTRRETIGVTIQDQLGELGITVNFEAIDFNTLIEEVFSGQSFDAYIIGWRNGFPADPDQTQLFGPAGDDPANQGSNGSSYNNPAMNELMAQAAVVPGCAVEDRAALYAEVQQILQDDQPYLWLFSVAGAYAAGSDIENFDPRANVPLWNIDAWVVSAQ